MITKITLTDANNTPYTRAFHFDQKIMEGLYFTATPKLVRNNLNKFKIKKQPAKNSNDIGMKVSKLEGNVILTMNTRRSGNLVFQYLVSKDVSMPDLQACDHDAVKGLKIHIIQAVSLAKVKTMQDLLNME